MRAESTLELTNVPNRSKSLPGHVSPHRGAGLIRVLCVDDHDLVIEGVRHRLDQESDLEFLGSLASADALFDVAEQQRPDIVLIDLQMPGRSPIDAIEEITRSWPDCRVVVLTGFVLDTDLTAACRAGVCGFFSKSDNMTELLEGLRRVSRGEFVLGRTAADRSRPSRSYKSRSDAESFESKLDSLTPREHEVLELIGSGLGRAGISETLGRSAKTVDGHRERIMQKLDIHSSPELVRFAIREGMATI